MNGRRGRFKVGDVELKLARPNLTEMEDIAPKVRVLLEEPGANESFKDINEILTLAVADESEADKEAFRKLEDAEDRLELWDQWVKHANLEKLFTKRALLRLEKIRGARKEMLMKMGATEQQVETYFHDQLMTILDSTSSLLSTMDSPLPLLIDSTTGMLSVSER